MKVNSYRLTSYERQQLKRAARRKLFVRGFVLAVLLGSAAVGLKKLGVF